MKITKIIIITVCNFILSFCLLPLDCLAATDSATVIEKTNTIYVDCVTCENIDDTMSLMSMRSSVPVCDHSDPTNPLNPHSSMRYIRTVDYVNYIENRIDVRDWYQCIICGYETFFVHGYKELN